MPDAAPFWDDWFRLTNLVAVIGWTALAFLPRWRWVFPAILFGAVGLLCTLYVVMAAGMLGGWFDPVEIVPERPQDLLDYSIAGLRWLFMSDGGIVIAWTHYLAFDLLAGMWIAREADERGVHRVVQFPILALTFLSGPFGFLLWLLVRGSAQLWAERRQRRLSDG